MNKILVIGDTHIGNLYKLIKNEMTATNIYDTTFNQIYQILKEDIYSGIILTGDIIGGTKLDIERNNYRALSYFLDFVHTLSSFCPVHIISGNHDKVSGEYANYGVLSILELVKKHTILNENIHIYTKRTKINIAGKDISLLPYPHKTPVTEPGSIVISHIDPYNCYMTNTGDLVQEISVNNKDFYWYTGHIHIYDPEDESNLIVGSLFNNNIKEKHVPSVIVLNIDDTGLVKSKRVVLGPKLFFTEILLDTEDDITFVANDIRTRQENSSNYIEIIRYSNIKKYQELNKLLKKSSMYNSFNLSWKPFEVKKNEIILKEEVKNTLSDISNIDIILPLYLKEVVNMDDKNIEETMDIFNKNILGKE